jgi:5-methylcytosine-specific restriction endonuclease McrA
MDHWHRLDREKVCISCGQGKPLSAFYSYGYTTTQGKRSTRYESRCQPCARARRKAQYHADPVKAGAINKAWKDANKQRIAAYNRERQADPDHRALKAKSQRLRKARMRSGEGDNDAIRAIYAEAMRVEKLVADCPVFNIPELGHKMHVDHIRPLSKGGRHHENNLQILPIGLNMRKGVKCPA